jgi:hypothetical protein
MAGAAAVALIASGCGPSSPQPTLARYAFTCCRSSDVDQLYHPGSIVTIHWLVEPAPAAPGPPTRITLSVALRGPYRSVDALKSAPSSAPPALTAPDVVVTDTSEASPVSTLSLPTDLAPGFYDLVDQAGAAGVRAGGMGIVQVG